MKPLGGKDKVTLLLPSFRRENFYHREPIFLSVSKKVVRKIREVLETLCLRLYNCCTNDYQGYELGDIAGNSHQN